MELEVGRAESNELANADAGIRKGADDELVPLGLRGVFHRLDLPAREDVYELLGKPRQLRFDRDRLTFPVGPG